MLKSKELPGYCIRDNTTGAPMLGQEVQYDGKGGHLYVKVFPTKEMAGLALEEMSRVNDDGTWNLEQYEIVPVTLVYQADE